MKLIIINIITFYQKIISIVLKNILGVSSFCRFKISCSEYAKQAIKKYGIMEGLRLSLVRVISCQPFSTK